MSTKLKVGAVTAVLLGVIIPMRRMLLFLLLVASCCQAGDTNRPITFRYIKNGEFNNKGYISYGTIFWATNHTTNTLAVDLATIENKAGSNWIVQSRQVQPLLFQPPGQPVGQFQLAPHTAGYATVQLSSQPTGTTWRAKATVAPVLTGFSATAARVRRYPDMVQRRLQYGNTNIPLNPFATNITFYGKTIDVVSQEVSEE